jgi:hypothetical protein
MDYVLCVHDRNVPGDHYSSGLLSVQYLCKGHILCRRVTIFPEPDGSPEGDGRYKKENLLSGAGFQQIRGSSVFERVRTLTVCFFVYSLFSGKHGFSYRVVLLAHIFQNVKKQAAMIFTSLILS